MSEPRDPNQPGFGAPTPPPPPAGATPSAGWGDPSTWTQPAATVPSPHAAAGAPPKPRGRAWLVVLLIVLGLIVAMAAGGTVLFATRTLPPFNGAHDFLEDVRTDRPSASHVCAAQTPDQAVRQERDQIQSFGDPKTITVNALGVDRTGNTATVDFTVTYRGGGASHSFSLTVVDENGTWKACP
jgi:flagellar basal body-associated protein FliL